MARHAALTRTVKPNLKVDWAEPHRDDVKAEIRAAVKRVLRKREVRAEDFDPLVERIMEQAEALYANWSVAASAFSGRCAPTDLPAKDHCHGVC